MLSTNVAQWVNKKSSVEWISAGLLHKRSCLPIFCSFWFFFLFHPTSHSLKVAPPLIFKYLALFLASLCVCCFCLVSFYCSVPKSLKNLWILWFVQLFYDVLLSTSLGQLFLGQCVRGSQEEEKKQIWLCWKQANQACKIASARNAPQFLVLLSWY